jgi:hypothetical protein
MRRRHVALGVGAICCGIGPSARAQTAPRRYATMSLVGDQLTAVGRAEQVGSHISRNALTEIKINGDIVDRAALGVVNDLIVKSEPTAKPLSLLIDEPVLYEQQARLFDGQFVRLPLDIVKAAKDGGATHMLLLTKQRATLSFPFDIGGRAGEGTANGLGFYVDPNRAVRDLNNNRRVEGFLGLYVHIRATVVEFASERIVGDRPIVASEMYINTREGFGGLPWDSLSPQMKVQAVAELLMKALRSDVPPLLNT